MIKSVKFIILIPLMVLCWSPGLAGVTPGVSYYQIRPEDPEAIYFTPENLGIRTDAKSDISDLLQKTINKLKLEQNIGVIFIPEGTYTISKTIYIPAAIRLIGYGKHRPLIVLLKNSPGFQVADSGDKGKARYMFWFTSSVVDSSGIVNDAGAGTFYSALSNIDLKIEEGNPVAVALRTHYAQHSFVSHCDIFTGQGKAGMFDIGNEMEDVRFFGGDYGIYTTKASPGWQFMMLDTYFEGQRKVAIRTREAGLTIVRMNVRNVPRVIEVESNFWEKLYMEDCQWVNVTGPAISFDDEGNAHMQINLRNITCKKVPLLVELRKSNKKITGEGEIFRVKRFVYGLQMEDQGKEPEIKTIFEPEALSELPVPTASDIPPLPDMTGWINLKSLGARGDGETDDTRVLQQAIDKYSTIYVPQGLYRVSETIKLRPNTVIIGLHPMATQFILGENTAGFSGFGEPRPMVEVPSGGKNVITGIGLSTGEYNYSAVACKWMAGPGSLMNDVKFVGGHGTMRKGPYTPWRGNSNAGKKPVPVQGPDPAWDTQYWSLWITNGGGGIFKNIWTASSYATSGIYISNTSTPSCIYALSVEHHVRNEVRFSEVANWRIYALQLEEESREGPYCQPMEISNSRDLLFANLYLFRVIRVKTPYPWSIRTWNCENVELLNIHNYSQVKYTTDNPLFDVNSDIEVRPQEFARLMITARPDQSGKQDTGETVKLVARGFEFAEGLCSDSKGNVYFSEQRMKRIYKWSAESNSVSLLADYPWEPLSLACDSKDNLLVVFRYNPQPGFMINGEQEKFSNPPDASGTSFSGWGNSGFGTLVYALDPDNADESIRILNKKPMNTVSHVFKALYPANRWRDSHDFNTISVNKNAECFVAPDSSTIIPVCYDLARSCALIEAYPGKQVFASDEYDKRTVRLDVDDHGYLMNLVYFAEKGEFSAVPDKQYNVYIADGEIYKYDKTGTQTGLIHIPERPSTMAFGGADHQLLFVTGHTALYLISAVNK